VALTIAGFALAAIVAPGSSGLHLGAGRDDLRALVAPAAPGVLPAVADPGVTIDAVCVVVLVIDWSPVDPALS
jgi:hypothetical protein